MTTSTKPRIPAVTCKPWCEYGDGHPTEWCVEDQWCATEALRIPLSLEPTLIDACSETPMADYYDVYASQVPGEPLLLRITHGGWAAPKITPAEAHQLIEALQLILGQIETGR